MKNQATIKDVASRAGCGLATASRVLNKTGSASADMQQRVLKAAKELKFQFNEVGRSFKSNTTRTIGCVVPSLANPVYADAVQGTQEALLEAGYQVLLVCTKYDSEIETQTIQTLIAKQVDGFVLTVNDTATSEGLALIKERQIPYCLLFNAAEEKQVSWSVDDYGAAKSVADVFAENNHMHTGFIALEFQTSDRSHRRYNGFVEGCARNNMAKPALMEIDEYNQNLTDLLKAFLEENPKVTGIFTSNDFLAISMIRSARELKLDVPKELSIVGFDGIDIGTMIEPSLATIVTDPRMLGGGASKAVLSKINKTPLPDIPDPDQTFSFRAGGSLTPLIAERRDDEEVAASSPSDYPTK